MRRVRSRASERQRPTTPTDRCRVGREILQPFAAQRISSSAPTCAVRHGMPPFILRSAPGIITPACRAYLKASQRIPPVLSDLDDAERTCSKMRPRYDVCPPNCLGITPWRRRSADAARSWWAHWRAWTGTRSHVWALMHMRCRPTQDLGVVRVVTKRGDQCQRCIQQLVSGFDHLTTPSVES